MAERKKFEKHLEGEVTFEGKLTTKVIRFVEYLVRKRVGLGPHEAHELQGYVDTLMERGSSEAEAWSLIISVEQWAQARTALTIAICALVISVVIGVCSPLVSIWELSIFLNLSRT